VAPRYTVLLPTHNRADVVGLAIESVLAQTERDFELLVVGDGCTDSTAEVVRAVGDSRVRWFDLPKAPAFGYANRNVALREATGELVAFMAHDDLMLPDHLEVMGERFKDPAVEWAYSRPLWVSDDGAMVPFAVDLRQPDELEFFLSRHNSIPASCVVYRRSLRERVGFWPEDVQDAADWEMWRRMIASGNGHNLAYVRQPTTLHFRADWRTGPTWGPPPLPAWLTASTKDWWPESLRLAVTGTTAQSAFADALHDAQFVDRLRDGVDQAVDALAWTQAIEIDSLREREATNRASVEELRAQFDGTVMRLRELKSELLQLRQQVSESQVRNAELSGELSQQRYDVSRIPLRHMIRLQRRFQVRFGANPLAGGDGFSRQAYLAANPDVAASGMDPLNHYYVYGMLEGRSTR
jgi:ribosomal protein L29